MKTLRLNEKEIDVSIEKTDTLRTIVTQVGEWSKGINEYPIKIVIDSQEYAILDNGWHHLALDSIDTVDIYTFSPSILRDYLPQLHNVSELLQHNKKKQAMQCIATISMLLSHTISIIPLLTDHTHEETKSQIKELTDDFNDLYQSIAQDDIILIGDLLEYEIHEKIERLLSTMNA